MMIHTFCNLMCLRGYSKDFFQLHKSIEQKLQLSFEKSEAQHFYVN